MKRKRKNKKADKTEEKQMDEAIQETEVAEEELTKEEALEKELVELKDKHLRLFAEFENFRVRNAKMRIEAAGTCAGETVKKLLPILDDFNRAGQNEEFTEGVNLVHQKLKSTFEQLGVKEMESTGQEFNPDFHEAITEIPAPSEDMVGKVMDTIEPGYLLNDKVLRYAKVVVGKA